MKPFRLTTTHHAELEEAIAYIDDDELVEVTQTLPAAASVIWNPHGAEADGEISLS